MTTYLPWLLSAGTLLVMWLAGNGSKWAWYLGIAIQPLWIAFAMATDADGLIALSLALMVIYARNLRHWYEAHHAYERAKRALYAQKEQR